MYQVRTQNSTLMECREYCLMIKFIYIYQCQIGIFVFTYFEKKKSPSPPHFQIGDFLYSLIRYADKQTLSPELIHCSSPKEWIYQQQKTTSGGRHTKASLHTYARHTVRPPLDQNIFLVQLLFLNPDYVVVFFEEWGKKGMVIIG